MLKKLKGVKMEQLKCDILNILQYGKQVKRGELTKRLGIKDQHIRVAIAELRKDGH